MICIKNLSVDYEAVGERYTAIDNINLTLRPGETCALIGPSGCGKSTILKVLAGIIKDFTGTVEINGQPIMPSQQKIGFIPQNYGIT